MKKSVAARQWWFNYTAQRRHEEMMRRQKQSFARKFTHGLLTLNRSFVVMMMNLWLRIQWYFKRLVK